MSVYNPGSEEQAISNYQPDESMGLPSRENLSELLEENLNRLLGVPKRLNFPDDGYVPPDLMEQQSGQQAQAEFERAKIMHERSAQAKSQALTISNGSFGEVTLLELMCLDSP